MQIYDRTDPRRHLRLNHPAALPLKAGDAFCIEAELDRPAYVDILWIDTDGKVHPVYPRDVDLRAELGQLPAQDEKDMRAAVWFENGEVVRHERLREPKWEARKANDPVLATQARVRAVQQKHLDYSRAVNFANQGR